MRLRDAVPADAGAIAAIYGHYVAETAVSLEEVPPSAEEMARRMALIRPPYPWLVAEDEGGLLGYAYAGAYHARAAYRWTCETTVYLDRERRGRGVGGMLYSELLARLERAGFVTAVAAATLPNAETVGFHEALGFRPAGLVAGVGWKLGRWWDVGYWQRELAPRGAPPAEPQPR